MKIRRFYSKNMRAALRQVTDEFGQDAAIISSHKTSTGVEVIAALDYDQDLLSSAVQKIDNRSAKKNSDHDSEINPELKTEIRAGNDVSIARQTQLQKTDNEYASVVNNIHSEQKETRKLDKIEWASDPGITAMREELYLMRSMMSEQLKGIGWQRFREKNPMRAMLARRFTSLGIKKSITSHLIPQVKKQQDAECCWQNLLALLAKSISVSDQDLLNNGGIYAFMGPTGAGKTTTIAKLAARFVIKHGADSVVLISADNYRISAQQQLSSFARLLGVAVSRVSAKKSLDCLLNHFKSKKLILIDTAGMSRKDLDIAKQLESLKHTNREIKRFLLIPATNQLAVVKQSLALFQRFSPYSVIITKLDEAASLGEVLSLVIDSHLPVAFTTDGQRVPEDIRVARSHHLVSKAVWLTSKFGTNAEDWRLAQSQQQAQYA